MTKETANLAARLWRTSDFPEICFYCGEPASDKEHVVPKSLVGENTDKVWSCRECNNIAGAKVFDDIYEKREFILIALERKYSKIINIPNWDDNEIVEMGWKLKKQIRSDMEKKKWIRKRLTWDMTAHALVVAKSLELNDIGRSSVPTNVEAKRMKQRREMLLNCIEEQSYPDWKIYRIRQIFSVRNWQIAEHLGISAGTISKWDSVPIKHRSDILLKFS